MKRVALPRGILRLLAAAALIIAPASLATGYLPTPRKPALSLADGPEAMLLKGLAELAHSRPQTALAEIEKLLAKRPDFRLAHLVRGDLLLARTRPIEDIGSATGAPADRLEDLRAEARLRAQRLRWAPPANLLPQQMLQLDSEQDYALLVDLAKARLYVFRNVGGMPHYVADYYVSSGKRGADKLREGDQKTPVGVYFVTDRLNAEKLGDFYGSGAYPINYPNEWDRSQGRNGHGIWLHGTPSDTYSRPPRASNGCVVLSNPDMTAVGRLLQTGVTPVVIGENVEWEDRESWQARRDALLKGLESWRSDWQSLDDNRYLNHYSRDFRADGKGLPAWAEQKRRTNAAKKWVEVKVSDVSVFAYPGRDDLAVVTFRQDYRSSNFSEQMRKRQYWAHEGNQWRIVYEGPA